MGESQGPVLLLWISLALLLCKAEEASWGSEAPSFALFQVYAAGPTLFPAAAMLYSAVKDEVPIPSTTLVWPHFLLILSAFLLWMGRH